MILGGLLKTSFIDFPSKLSAVVFTQGCDFHCPYCHNPDLVPPRPRPDGSAAPDQASVLAFLAKRQGLLAGVVISGGEPTCQDPLELEDFLRSVKKMGYPVKLDTNGSRPSVVDDLLAKGLVDHLAIDVKSVPGSYPASLASREAGAKVPETIALALSAHKAGRASTEFRTTCYHPIVDESAIMEIAQFLSGPAPLFLQAFNPGRVLSPAAAESAGLQPSKDVLARWAALASAWLPCQVR